MVYWVILFFLGLFLFFYKKKNCFSSFKSHPWKGQKISFKKKILFKEFSQKHSYFASKHPLIGKSTKEQADIELTQSLLLNIHEQIKDYKTRLITTTETLTKVLAYRDLKEGSQIKIPITDSWGRNILVNYVVDKVFDIWNEMPAFGLIPKNHIDEALPILLFRGTDFSLLSKRGRASILSDLDIEGPGYKVFQQARVFLNPWLKKTFQKTNKKTRIMGYSLGGSFTSYTLIYENDLIAYDWTQPSVAFNPSGVVKKIAEKWDLLSKKPPYLVFITKKDLVPKFRKVLGEVYNLIPSKQQLPIHAHLEFIIGQDSFYLEPKKPSFFDRKKKV